MMRKPYLLAASFLAALAIPASALPGLSHLAPDRIPDEIGNVEKQSLVMGLGQPVAPPSIETALPEFSNQKLLVSAESSLLNQNLQPPSNRRLISNSQLYYQRLAALRTGQIYTRIDYDRLQSLWVSTKKRKPTYEDWKILLALEARALVEGQGANHLSILVGDSLSMWFPSEKLPTGKLWLNQGISGDTSTGVAKRLGVFSKTRPDVIYVMAGINDLRKGTSDTVILRNHRRIIRRLRYMHPETKIIVQSILPTRMPTIPNTRIRNLNDKIAAIAKEEGANFLSIHTWFADYQGNLRPDLTTDGLHLSENGYDVWRWAIVQIENKLTASRTITSRELGVQITE